MINIVILGTFFCKNINIHAHSKSEPYFKGVLRNTQLYLIDKFAFLFTKVSTSFVLSSFMSTWHNLKSLGRRNLNWENGPMEHCLNWKLMRKGSVLWQAVLGCIREQAKHTIKIKSINSSISPGFCFSSASDLCPHFPHWSSMTWQLLRRNKLFLLLVAYGHSVLS